MREVAAAPKAGTQRAFSRRGCSEETFRHQTIRNRRIKSQAECSPNVEANRSSGPIPQPVRPIPSLPAAGAARGCQKSL